MRRLVACFAAKFRHPGIAGRLFLFLLLAVGLLTGKNGALALPIHHQQKPISGKIQNADGSPLPGATIMVKGATTASTADAQGNFSIEIPDNINNPVLVVSAVGYTTKEIPVKGSLRLDIRLDVDIKKLNDVVVVGYGTQKRKDLTGSSASLSSAQIEQRPVSSYEDAIAGVVPGIDVAPRSAKPGNISEITIRGIGTISGDREPLFVVDGFPIDANNASPINPANILSIDILKDASSTAIYGSRGANGVIIITTKSGKAGLAKVDISLKQGFAQANKHDFYKVLSGAEYVEWYKEKAQFAGTPIPSWVTNWDGTSTNWQDYIYRTAPFRDYNVTVTGGSDKFTYMFSGGFLNQEDILLNAGYDKYSARVKMDYKASKRITMGITLAPNFTVQRLSAPEDD